jgi:hypothetical protein
MGKGATQVFHNALGKLRSELDAMPAAEVHEPPIPVDRLVGEALALAVVSKQTEESLTQAGLDPDLIRALPARAAALAEAEAEWKVLRALKRTETEVALERSGVELRADLVADARFALRHDRDAQAVIDQIQEGEGLDDLVQDLKELETFVRKHTSAFSRIGVRIELKAQRARKIAAELEGHLASRRGSDREESGAQDLRDRAASHLQAAMSEIRATGAYVFRKRPALLVKFRSAYYRERRLRREKPAPAPPPTA